MFRGSFVRFSADTKFCFAQGENLLERFLIAFYFYFIFVKAVLFFSSSCFGSNSWREVRKVCDSCDRWLAATCLRCLLRGTNLFVVLEQGHWIKKEQVTISFLVWKFSLKLINSECAGEGGMLFKDGVWFPLRSGFSADAITCSLKLDLSECSFGILLSLITTAIRKFTRTSHLV